MLVDSHCHLDFPDFAADLDGTVARARAAGVGTMLTINTRLSHFDGVLAVAERFDDIYCTVGIHPHEAHTQGAIDAARLVELARHPKVVGFGETGLDYFYEHSPRAEQVGSFVSHIVASRELNLPVIIHTRDADDETGRILVEEYQKQPFTGLIHCFSAGRELAEKALELGFYISLSGILTFNKAEELRTLVRDLPMDRLLVETDSPYLAPVPKRGKTNEPSFVVHTAAKLAEIKGISLKEVEETTTANFFRLFSKDSAMKITVLGCGGAGGVPMISAGWGRCDPQNPKNRRRRQSILVEGAGQTVLVDTSPDLREQLLDAGVRHLDAVLYTHAHADHVHGIDELREVNRAMKAPIPVYGMPDTMAEIEQRFADVFTPLDMATETLYKPCLIPHHLTGPFRIGALDVVPFDQDHGFSRTTGFRFGSAAYSTDVMELPEASLAQLSGLDVWIVGCLLDVPHATHAHVGKVLTWVERLQPKLTVLTHMSLRLDYATLSASLPAGVAAAYDGMVLEV